jgi:membrane protease subunit (stomatin/prohibitin family)
MGLIKALATGVGSALGDQWLEYIYCDEMPEDVLLRKGAKRTRQGSSNTRGSDNIITQGSRIAVNEGQFLLVVDNGKVVDFTDETGVYTFDKSTEPSMLYGGFGKGLLDSFKKVGERFTFGGDTGHDQRVYFVNKKLITDNKFGTKSPIPFRDSEWNITVNITCFGTYVYKVTDPLLFYANLAGNVDYEYRRDTIQEQFKSDLCASLLPALGQVATQHVSYDMLPGAVTQLTDAVKASLKTDWEDKVGINVDRIKIEGVSPTDEDAAKIKALQETRVYSNAQFAQGAKAQAQVGYINGLGQGAAKGGQRRRERAWTEPWA